MSFISTPDTWLEELLKKAGELKSACDDIDGARKACEAVEKAIAKVTEAEDVDLLDTLDLLGDAVDLLSTFAPEGTGAFFQAYAEALHTVATSLAAIALTAYDKALDRALGETDNLADAVKVADRFLPDAPAEDRARAIKRAKTRAKQAELKKKGYEPPKRWYQWGILPWNWLTSVPVPPAAALAISAGLMLTATLALASIGDCGAGLVSFLPQDASVQPTNAPAQDLIAVPPRPFVPPAPCRNVEIVTYTLPDGEVIEVMLRIDEDLDGWCDRIVWPDGRQQAVSLADILSDVATAIEDRAGYGAARAAINRYRMTPPVVDVPVTPAQPVPAPLPVEVRPVGTSFTGTPTGGETPVVEDDCGGAGGCDGEPSPSTPPSCDPASGCETSPGCGSDDDCDSGSGPSESCGTPSACTEPTTAPSQPEAEPAPAPTPIEPPFPVANVEWEPKAAYTGDIIDHSEPEPAPKAAEPEPAPLPSNPPEHTGKSEPATTIGSEPTRVADTTTKTPGR